MGTTQPIRDKSDLKQFMEYYRLQKPHPRNYALVTLGIHTALRISDILSLRWRDLFDFEKDCFCTHLFLQEKKTGKQTVIALNPHIKEALLPLKELRVPDPDDYIFSKSTTARTPLCRSQAFRIIKEAAGTMPDREHISCHSLRKTFGYHAWKQGTPPALLMDVYNHSSYQITKKYLGIGQDERDSLFLDIDL